MTDKLPWPEIQAIVEEYKDSIPSSGVLRLNHSTDYCSGSSKSMSVRYGDDGRIFISCFRCGKFGSYSETFHRHKKAKGTSVASRTEARDNTSDVIIPHSTNFAVETWPGEVRGWFYKYGIRDEEILQRKLGLYNRRIVIPVYIGDCYIGFQSRKMYNDDTPKYITRTNDPARMLYFVSENRNSIVIVEDFLSAIKVGRVYDAVAVMGTELSTWGLRYLSRRYSNFIIALDNDNTTVKRKQQKLKRALQDFGNVRVCYLSDDPKNLTTEEIRDVFA